jgi:hypothetical protein
MRQTSRNSLTTYSLMITTSGDSCRKIIRPHRVLFTCMGENAAACMITNTKKGHDKMEYSYMKRKN